MTGLQLLTNNTESYAKAFHFKVAEQKISQIWRNTHPSHITRIRKAVKSNALQQYKPHLTSLSDTSVYMRTHPCKHTHTYNVHYCRVKSLKLILNPEVIPFISAHWASQVSPTCLSAVSWRNSSHSGPITSAASPIVFHQVHHLKLQFLFKHKIRKLYFLNVAVRQFDLILFSL